MNNNNPLSRERQNNAMKNYTRYYKQTKKEPPKNYGTFDYLQTEPTSTHTISLTGRFRRRIPQYPSSERSIFKPLKLLTLPNSKRTMDPNLQDKEPTSIRSNNSNQSKFNKESTEFGFVSNVDIKTPHNKSNPKLYSSSVFDSSNNSFSRPLSKPTLFDKYTKTTQIYGLPGGCKRDINEILDDRSRNSFQESRDKSRDSYRIKVKHDYNSNIECLPGSTINTKVNRFRKYGGMKNDGNNIFNNNTNSTNGNIGFYTPNTGKKMNLFNSIVEKNKDSSYFGRRIREKPVVGIKARYRNQSNFKII